MCARSLAEFSEIARQLAVDSSRILEWVQGLPSRVDRLLAAALDRDWREVDRITEELAGMRAKGCERVCQQARVLRTELSKPDNERNVQRVLVRLIFECGRVDPRNVERRRLRGAAHRTADHPH